MSNLYIVLVYQPVPLHSPGTALRWRPVACWHPRAVQRGRPVNLKFLHHAPFFQNGLQAKSGFKMCFGIGSQHLGCWGQNTSRIQNKEVYATLCLQALLSCSTSRRSQTASHEAHYQYQPKWRNIWIRGVLWSQYLGCWAKPRLESSIDKSNPHFINGCLFFRSFPVRHLRVGWTRCRAPCGQPRQHPGQSRGRITYSAVYFPLG